MISSRSKWLRSSVDVASPPAAVLPATDTHHVEEVDQKVKFQKLNLNA